MAEYHTFTEDALKRLCSAVNALARERDVLNDGRTTGSATWSSYKIDKKFTELEQNLKLYMIDNFGIGYGTKVLDTEPLAEDMSENVIYFIKVYKEDGSGEIDHYDQFILADKQKLYLGTTDVTFDDTYLKNEADEIFLQKKDVINTFNGNEIITRDNIPLSQTATKSLYDKVMNTMGSPSTQRTENKVTVVGGLNELYDKLEAYKTEVEQKLEDLKTQMKLDIYPIGAIYLATNNENPNTLFGGTWEKIEGKFLLGTSSTHTLGSTGGAESVTLSTTQIPSHNHSCNSNGAHVHDVYMRYKTMGSWYLSSSGNYPTASLMTANDIGDENKAYSNKIASAGSHNHTIGTTGGNSSHENMPPFLTISMWKRTA